MPPKKKKQPKNAFYFFMLDWKKEKEEQGQKFSGLAEVSKLCTEDWEHLPPHNKNYYKGLEKEAKQKDKSDLSNKFNSLGIAYEQLDRQKQEKDMFRDRMHNEIDNTLISISANVDSLKKHYFYLAHANVYCYWGSEQVYIPCEVAISKFNLQDGLVDTYHVFPSPSTPNGQIPLGYKFEVQENAQKVHDIPDPSEFDKTEYDWKKIRADVRNFLMPNGSTEVPPIFTIGGNDTNINCHMSAVETFFDYIANDSNDDFRVYELALLFFKLYQVCQRYSVDSELGFPIEGVAHQTLIRDIYNFCEGLSCSFHEETEHFYNCSLSYVKRWVFHIMEFCCLPLKIKLMPGKHCIATARILDVMKDPPRVQPQQQALARSQANTPLGASSSSSSSSFGSSANEMCVRSAGADGDDVGDDDNDGSNGRWCTVSKAQHGVKTLSSENSRQANTQNRAWSSGHQASGVWSSNQQASKKEKSKDEELVIIDHSRTSDASQTKVLRTGQAPNVVSEVKLDSFEPSVRRPTTHGRGELMARALSLQQSSPGASLSQEDFPAIGASKPARLAKPMAAGWGRGFLKPHD